jgi:hypothetical protein
VFLRSTIAAGFLALSARVLLAPLVLATWRRGGAREGLSPPA